MMLRHVERLGWCLGSLMLSAVANAAGTAAGGNAAYVADAQSSHLEFVGVQAGADFKGAFRKFTATVDFAPDSLDSSHIDVQIDLNSVDTLDADRDKAIRGSDIFDVPRWPQAHYITRNISKTATGFAATGTLTLRGITKDVPIDFSFSLLPGGAKLVGNARLKRLDFGAGQGDWKSTEWVGDLVKVSFSLALRSRI